MNGGPLRTDYKLEGCKQEVYDLQARLEAMRLDRDYYRAQRDRRKGEADELRREVERLTLPNIARDQLPMLYEQARREADQLRQIADALLQRGHFDPFLPLADIRKIVGTGHYTVETHEDDLAWKERLAALAGVQADKQPWGPDHPSYDEMGQ